MRPPRGGALATAGRGTAFTFIAPTGLPPRDSHACCTPWSVFQDGSDAAIRAPTTAAQGATGLPPGTQDRRLPLHAVTASAAYPTRAAQPPRGGPALQRARLATLLSRPRNVQTPGYKFPTRTRSHLPRRPPGPGATAVGRLPAEVQSCRTARLAAEQPRPDGTATTSPEPDGEPLQPHSFPS